MLARLILGFILYAVHRACLQINWNKPTVMHRSHRVIFTLAVSLHVSMDMRYLQGVQSVTGAKASASANCSYMRQTWSVIKI
jgi:hypothetical protein